VVITKSSAEKSQSVSGIPSEQLARIRIEMAVEDDGKKGIRL
jgi:hypothetical protein